ncbi:MAG: hypothetical protein ACR2G4_09930 [Pyrinomonadaceae bacterium]
MNELRLRFESQDVGGRRVLQMAAPGVLQPEHFMKKDFDQEMDSLLRAQARRDRASAFGEPGAASLSREDDRAFTVQSGPHLDADELNAYAENALPASTRTHYSAHLADCDHCRRTVTQLALAAGIPAQLEQREAPTAAESASMKVSWRERIGAWRSARAWRYAIPLFALLLVSASVLLVTLQRSARNEKFIAGRDAQPSSRPAPAAQPGSNQAQESSDIATTANSSGGAIATRNSSAAKPKQDAASQDAASGDAPAAAPAARPNAEDAMVSNNAPLPSGSAASAPAIAAELPAPLPTPAPVAEAAGMAAEAEAKTKAAQAAEDQVRMAEKPRNVESSRREETNVARLGAAAGSGRSPKSNNQRDRTGDTGGSDESGASLPPPSAAKRARTRRPDRGGDNAESSADDAARKDESRAQVAAETRAIAGRKFRRQGGAWVDTAYNAAQAVTVVRRNSEQYRALVADEPQLRRITDALGGEVTVVWKGRAYRFRESK